MTGGSAPAAGSRVRDGLFVVDVLTVFAGVVALGVLLLGGLRRWFVGSDDLLTGGLGVVGFACGALLVLAAGLVLERLRWDRRAGHGATFDERFRWIDAPETEEAHEAAALASAPTWVRALRPAA